MIVKPITKYTLTDIQGIVLQKDQEIDVTNDIGNWDELVIEQKREKTSGVISEVSFPLTFHRNAKDLIDKLFETKGFLAEAQFKIYNRADFTDEYELLKSIKLDFSTYSYSTISTEIEAINDDLAEFLSSRKSTEYDIAVNEIADPKHWNYERMKLLDEGTWTIPSWDGETKEELETYSIYLDPNQIATFLLCDNEVEMTPGGYENIFETQDLAVATYNGQNLITGLNTGFFQAAEKNKLTPYKLKIKAKFKARPIDLISYAAYIDTVKLVLLWGSSKYGYKIIREWKPVLNTDPAWEWDLDYTTEGDEMIGKFQGHSFPTLFLNPGDRLALAIVNTDFKKDDEHTINSRKIRAWADQDSNPTVTMSYLGQARQPFVKIPVIDPATLLQKFIDLMTEQNPEKRIYTSEIQWGNLYPEQVKPMICAAESIRGFDNAILHGKYKDFYSWMQTLGYEYDILNNHLTFKPRDEFFKREITSLTLDNSEVAELEIEADDNYAYTNVKIGYDKQDYESINGRAEVNGTFEYTTGYIRRDEKTLELISPYRADSIGLELLCRKALDKSNATDNESDNDIFFVAVTENEKEYVKYTGFTITDKETKVTLYNAPFCPYFLALANKSLLGITSNKLTFTSTDTNRMAELTQANIYANLTLDKQLFKPEKYTISTGNFKKLPTPDQWNGLVKFTIDDKERSGFICSITKNYANENKQDWEIWAI